MFGPLAKWVAEIDSTERIPEYLHRAWSVALSGGPGPVVLALPEDMLSAEADVPDRAPAGDPAGPRLVRRGARRRWRCCAAAERPLVVVGGPHWSEAARGGPRGASRRRRACPWPRRSGGRTGSTTATRTTRATST